MTIKYLMYMRKVPVLYTERACVVFLVLKFAQEDFVCRTKCCEYFGPEGVGHSDFFPWA